MDPHDFLSAVLPTSGLYCAAEYDTPRKAQSFVTNLEELIRVVQKHSANKINAYYALASFEKSGTRVATNAVALRSIFIDVDVGAHKNSPYATQKQAAAALAKFVEDAQLPTPIVVSSGHGVHAYWTFTEDIPRAEWVPAAERFKRLCLKHGLVIDNHVTGDAARVLRVPGTVNYVYPENPRPVRVVLDGDGPIDFHTLADRLAKEINGYDYVAEVTTAIPGVPLANRSATAVKLFQNTATRFKTILKRTREGTGCGQLLHYVENASNDGMEPLWRAMLSIAKFSDDGEKAAVLLSELHPYDAHRMRTKLNEIKGPYTCAAIDGINPGGCTGCPHAGKIKSPIVLGHETMLDTGEEKILPANPPPVEGDDEPVSAAPQIHYVRPPPPLGFAYGQNGGVYAKVKEEDRMTGEETSRTVCVIPYDLFVTGSLTQDPEHNHIHVVAYQPSGVREIAIPARALVSKDDTLKALGAHLVYSTNNHDKLLYEFVKKSASDMTVLRGPRKVPETYGWQEGGSFVIAGKEYLPDGSVATAPTSDDHANLLPITTPVGDPEIFRKVVAMLYAKGRIDILLTVCASMGAALMEFTGFKGMLLNVQSHETGTGKSVALSIAASVWGNPMDYLVTPDTSVVTTQLRMGMLHSLPLIMDEVTYKTRSYDSGDSDWSSKFLLDLTMGKSKERMEAAVTKERKNIVRWATIAIMSSNSSIVDALTSRNYTTNGELQRLLEIDMHDKLVLTREEEQLLSALQKNYGLAGHKFIKWVVANQKRARGILDEANATLRAKFNMQSHERFWLNGLAASIAAAIICSSDFADVVQFPTNALLDEAGKLVVKSRGVVVDNVRTAHDVLHAFIRENYGNFLVIRKRAGELAASLGVKDIVDESITRSSVKGRIEHGFKEGIAGVFIEKAVLAQHCHSMSYNSAAFKKELAARYTVTDDVKKNLFSHTKVKSVRVNAVCIELPENELDEPVDDTEVAS